MCIGAFQFYRAVAGIVELKSIAHKKVRRFTGGSQLHGLVLECIAVHAEAVVVSGFCPFGWFWRRISLYRNKHPFFTIALVAFDDDYTGRIFVFRALRPSLGIGFHIGVFAQQVAAVPDLMALAEQPEIAVNIVGQRPRAFYFKPCEAEIRNGIRIVAVHIHLPEMLCFVSAYTKAGACVNHLNGVQAQRVCNVDFLEEATFGMKPFFV
jgi:hypothetical protein